MKTQKSHKEKEGKQMFDEERMELHMCIECDKQIQIDEGMILIYKNDFVECWVHSGECWEKYKKLLTGPEAIKQGCIIGVCDYCAKPVRDGDDYLAGRTGTVGETVFGRPKKENPFYTTFPLKEAICFAHKKCYDEDNQ